MDMGRIEVEVAGGQMIYFVENSLQNADHDTATWEFRIEYFEK